MSDPVFIATAEGADAVIRRGNRRRRITAFTSLAAVATVLTVLVVAPWSGVGGRESLTPSDGGTFWPTPATTASPTPTTVDTSPTTPPSSPMAVPSSRASGNASPAPGASPTSPASPARRTSSKQVSPITRGTGSIGGQDLCQDDQTDAAQGWCIRYTGPTTARRGHLVTLAVELCRLGTFPAASVTFGSTREVVLDVAGWEAGQGVSYTSPGRTATLAPTQCLTWSSTWDTRDKDGFLVLPGSYYVDFGVDAGSQVAFARSGADLRVTD